MEEMVSWMNATTVASLDRVASVIDSIATSISECSGAISNKENFSLFCHSRRELQGYEVASVISSSSDTRDHFSVASLT